MQLAACNSLILNPNSQSSPAKKLKINHTSFNHLFYYTKPDFQF